VDVKTVMDTWTRQTGFPVVHVSVIGRHLKLRQERFLLDRRADDTLSTSDHEYDVYCCHLELQQLINDVNLYSDDYDDDYNISHTCSIGSKYISLKVLKQI